MWTAPFAASLLLMGACAMCQAHGLPAGERALALQKVFSGDACGPGTASVQALGDVHSVVQAAQCDALAGTPAPDVPVDFSSHIVVQVCMGTQSSSGAVLDVIRATQHRGKKRLTLHAHWSLPDRTRMQAAVITRPCVYVALPKGDYRSVRVLDTSGKLMLKSSLTL